MWAWVSLLLNCVCVFVSLCVCGCADKYVPGAYALVITDDLPVVVQVGALVLCLSAFTN